MLNYEPSSETLSKRKDIYEAIKMSGKFTPGNVIDIIKDHDEIHFGTKNLTHDLTGIILFAHDLFKHKTAEYIVNEFSHEIDFSYLAYQSIMFQVDANIVDDYFDKIEIKSTMITLPSAIVLQILKSTKDEYFEILLDNREVLNTLTQRNVQDMFHTFTSRLMRKPEIVTKWKVILSKFNKINDMMVTVVKDDIDLMAEYYPDATEMFLF